MAPSLSEWNASTPLSAGNAPYVEALYQAYLRDPQGVSGEWRAASRRSFRSSWPSRHGRLRRATVAGARVSPAKSRAPFHD